MASDHYDGGVRESVSDSSDLPFSDPAFLARLKRREHDAVEALVRAYTRRLHNTLLGMGFDRDDAQEVVQQVWVTFYEKAPSFEGRSHVRTYLYGILYHKARERGRMRTYDPFDESVERRVDSRFNGEGGWSSPPMAPERFALLAERMDILERCMEGLGDAQRAAFVMKEHDGLDSGDICNALGVTLTHLRVLLFRARNRLRECIEARDADAGEAKP
jgi:RNA polymerase sigma-70 factor (ECF subfamily)